MSYTVYPDEFKASALALLDANGYPKTKGALKRTARDLEMPHQTLSVWARDRAKVPAKVSAVKKFNLQEALINELELALEAMHEKRHSADYKALVVAIGILTDKLQLIKGEPTSRVETISRELDSLSDAAYEEALAEAEAVLAGKL